MFFREMSKPAKAYPGVPSVPLAPFPPILTIWVNTFSWKPCEGKFHLIRAATYEVNGFLILCVGSFTKAPYLIPLKPDSYNIFQTPYKIFLSPGKAHAFFRGIPPSPPPPPACRLHLTLNPLPTNVLHPFPHRRQELIYRMGSFLMLNLLPGIIAFIRASPSPQWDSVSAE